MNYVKWSIIIVIVLMALNLGSCASAASTDDLVIEDIDTLKKTVETGEKAEYRWELSNTGNSTYNVRVIISEPDPDWVVTVEGNRQFTLGPHNSSSVTITATPSADEAPEEERVTVIFSISSGPDAIVEQRTIVVGRESEKLIFGVFRNPLPSPLDNQIGDFVLSLLIWIVIIVLVTVVLRYVIIKLTGKTRIKLDNIIVNAVRTPLVFLLILYGIVDSVKLLDIPTKILNFLDLSYEIAFTILVAYIGIRILSALVEAGIRISKKLKEPSISKMLLPMTRKIGNVIIIIVGIFAILDIVGLDITFFVTSMGVIGIVVAFAAQDSLSNIFAGLHLMLDQSFKIGDRILLPQKIGSLYSSWGDVRHIGLRTTKVRSTDGIILTIPNKLITENSLTNFSHMEEPSLRARIRLGLVPVWSNVLSAERIIERAANAHPDVQEKPRLPQVVLRDFGHYDVVMELRFYVENPKKMRMTKSDLIHEILKEFEAKNVKMSTPVTYNIESRVDPKAMGYGSLSKYSSDAAGAKKPDKPSLTGKGERRHH